MDQNEKNFSKLNLKFKSLQNEFQLLSEEKMRLEYDYKSRSESSNKQFVEVRNDMENLQLAFNEKLTQNKKLFQDYSNLQLILENKTNEINHLKIQLNEYIQVNASIA